MVTNFESVDQILRDRTKITPRYSLGLHHSLQIPLIAIRISTPVAVVLVDTRINVAHNNQGYKNVDVTPPTPNVEEKKN